MKSGTPSLVLSAGRSVVYPAHGIGIISGIETQEVAGIKMELLVVEFPQAKMTLRLPKARALSSGLRAVASPADVEKALAVLKGRSKSKKGIWSRRAAEFEGKIKSGDLVQIAEVLRDLARAEEGSSYSERQIYESAHARFVSEIAVAMEITETEASQLVESRTAKTLSKGSEEHSNDDGEDSAEEEAA